MIDYIQALEWLIDSAPTPRTESQAVQHAAGRVLAAPVVAKQALPPFASAAMDGFAVRTHGQVLSAGTIFRIGGRQAAGDATTQAIGADAWEIMTGARLPWGLDSVIPLEHVQIAEAENNESPTIRLLVPVTPGQHVRGLGQDVAQDETVLEGGTALDVHAMTMLHALGIESVQVRIAPKVAVISTGKELNDDTVLQLESGQIRDSNRPYLIDRLTAAGAHVVWQGMVGDDVADFDAMLDHALDAGAEIVISTGAVSQGRYDFIPDTLSRRTADIVFHGVAIRPGKPILFARLPDGALYFGLPGNPASAAVGQRFFVEPVLRHMLGLPKEIAWKLPLQADVTKPQDLRYHARARVEIDTEGRLSVRIPSGQEPFRLKTALRANAWAVFDGADGHVPNGSLVSVYGWSHAEPICPVVTRYVTVQLFGALSDLDEQGEIRIPFRGTHISDLRQTVRSLVTQRLSPSRARLVDRSVFADERNILRDSDPVPTNGRIAILPPVSGG